MILAASIGIIFHLSPETSALPSFHKRDRDASTANVSLMTTEVSLPVGPSVDSIKRVKRTTVYDSTAADSSIQLFNSSPISNYHQTIRDDPNNSFLVSEILDTTALPIFKKHLFDTIQVGLMASRCPTYFGFELANKQPRGFERVGNIVYHIGCPTNIVGKFKVNIKTGICLLQLSNSKEYVGWREYEFRRWGKAS